MGVSMNVLIGDLKSIERTSDILNFVRTYFYMNDETNKIFTLRRYKIVCIFYLEEN